MPFARTPLTRNNANQNKTTTSTSAAVAVAVATKQTDKTKINLKMQTTVCEARRWRRSQQLYRIWVKWMGFRRWSIAGLDSKNSNLEAVDNMKSQAQAVDTRVQTKIIDWSFNQKSSRVNWKHHDSIQ